MKRKHRRHIRYRPGNRRGLRLVRAGLACALAVSVLLSVQVIVRSIRTAKLNGQLEAMHTVEESAAPVAEIAVPLIEARAEMKLSFMGMPDGSAIQSAAVSAVPSVLHNTTGDILPDMLKLLRTNPDIVGWLYINGIVSLPVVYRDNEYYLTRDFNGHHNTSGTLFLDEAHPLTARAQNLLIHGHSMNDGSMFGLLTHYQKLETLVKHPLISFSTLWEKETYAVFAVMNVKPETFDYYNHPLFATNAAFDAYIAEVRARSLYDIPISVKPSDALLTLSTCIDDDRLVVLARKARPGETKDELIAAVEHSLKKTVILI